MMIACTLSVWTAGTTNVGGGTGGSHAGTGASGINCGGRTVLNVIIS